MNEAVQPIEQPATPVEPSPDDALSAIWDKFEADREGEPTAEATPAPATQTDEQPRGADGKFVAKDGDATPSVEAKPEADAKPAPVKGEETTEKAAESATDEAEDAKPAEDDKKAAPKSEAPGILPKAVRDKWGDLPEDVQEAFKASQEDMARRLGDATRQQQAIGPIFDAVKRAAAEIPQMANMKPTDIADEVFKLAGWAQSLQQDPVAALMSMAEQTGAADALKARLGGEQPSELAMLRQEMAAMRAEATRQQNSAGIEQIVDQRVQEQSATATVEQFARSKADWAEVEPHMPHFVQIMQAEKPGATPGEILEAAYEQAVFAVPSLRQQRLDAAQAEKVAQEKAQAAQQAAAINLKPNGAGQKTPLTEEQELSAIWDRRMSG